MNLKAFVWGMLLTSIAYAAGLSTPFVDVQLLDVPIGKRFAVETPNGKGIWIFNRSDQPIRVEITTRAPTPDELKPGSQAIPDALWLQPKSKFVKIPPQTNTLVPLTLKVPSQKNFRNQTFQVMIWTRMVPEANTPMTIAAGLLSRLRFTTR